MKKFYTAPITHALLPLWQRCFPGDEEAETRALLDSLAPDGMCLYAEENGTVVCQGILLLVAHGDHYGYYLYALCTTPSKRRQGYMRALIEAAARLRDQNGLDFLMLIPATEALESYYRHLGFDVVLPLSADATGRACYLHLPATEEETPFDGDYERLYLLSDRRLSLSVFCAALDSVQDVTDIFYTSTGFRVRSKDAPAYCFTADAASLQGASLLPGAHALAMPRTGLCLQANLIADPLPR